MFLARAYALARPFLNRRLHDELDELGRIRLVMLLQASMLVPAILILYLIVNGIRGYLDPLLFHAGAAVILTANLVGLRVLGRFRLAVFVFSSTILLLNLGIAVSTGEVVRSAPWWGCYLLMVAFFLEDRRSIVIWSVLAYAAVLVGIRLAREGAFYNAYLTATLSMTVYLLLALFYVSAKRRLVGELREALARVRTLSGLLPMCSSCKKIRNDSGYYEAVEGYIMKHSDASFSHTLCPDCIHDMYPDIDTSDLWDEDGRLRTEQDPGLRS